MLITGLKSSLEIWGTEDIADVILYHREPFQRVLEGSSHPRARQIVPVKHFLQTCVSPSPLLQTAPLLMLHLSLHTGTGPTCGAESSFPCFCFLQILVLGVYLRIFGVDLLVKLSATSP